TLPPLRERSGDVEELIHQFFERSKIKNDRPDLTLPASLMPYLVNYRWPGNVRELENVIERLVLLSRSDQITLADLPVKIRQDRPAAESAAPRPAVPSEAGLNAVERDLIVKALRESNWNQTRAARQLAISRKTLLYRMSKYGISKEDSDISQAPQKGFAT